MHTGTAITPAVGTTLRAPVSRALAQRLGGVRAPKYNIITHYDPMTEVIVPM
jgi:hypothetical protein